MLQKRVLIDKDEITFMSTSYLQRVDTPYIKKIYIYVNHIIS